MVKILVVTASFYPQQSPRSLRATELVKEFSRMGHFVSVLTYKNERHKELLKEYNINFLYLDGVRAKFFETTSSNVFILSILKSINFILQYLLEFPDCLMIPKIRRVINSFGPREFDLLISIAKPHPVHWSVASVWSKNKELNPAKVWVSDCGDPYIGNSSLLIKKPFYFNLIEKNWCKKSDFITVPIEEAKTAYFKEFNNKIHVVPQGFKLSEYFLNTNTNNNIPTFAYSGVFYKKIRDPRPFFDFLLKLDIEFRFYVFTTEHSWLKHYETSSNGRIIINNYIERKKLLDFLSKMDFLVNFNNTNQIQRPSKLIDYLILNKPVLSINSSNIDHKLFYEFINGNYQNKENLGSIENYNIEKIAKIFIDFLK